ncbi:MAG: ribonuclease HII [archaeon]
MIVAGVEEAGRGPVIGPLVMAIAAIDEKMIFRLKALGVKDSKLLTPARRRSLFEEVKNLCDHKIIKVSPKQIDNELADPNSNLNWLEAKIGARLINAVPADKVIIDCPSNNLEAYCDYVKKRVKVDAEVICEHKADVNHIIVGAASILAKVVRDNEIEKLKKKYDIEFGSGYPSDPKTVAFLDENYKKYDFFRKSWDTWKNIKIRKSQRLLI